MAMRLRDSIPVRLAIGVVLTWYFGGCRDSNPECGNNPVQTTALGLGGMQIIALQVDGNFLYACGGRKGLWKKPVDGPGPWNVIGFFGRSSAVGDAPGVVDIDASGNDILILYSVAGATQYDSSLAGIWRSRNAGGIFIRSDSGIINGDGDPSHIISHVARSRLNPSIGVAVHGATFRTTDGGDHWVPTSSFIPDAGPLELLSWDSDKELDVWFYGQTGLMENHVSHSADGGASWAYVTSFPQLGAEEPSIPLFRSMAFDAKNKHVMYAEAPYLLKSTDGGSTWFLPTGIPTVSVHPIISDPNWANRVYQVVGRAVYLSIDGGESMRLLAQSNSVIQAVAVDAQSGDIYLGTNSGVEMITGLTP